MGPLAQHTESQTGWWEKKTVFIVKQSKKPSSCCVIFELPRKLGEKSVCVQVRSWSVGFETFLWLLMLWSFKNFLGRFAPVGLCEVGVTLCPDLEFPLYRSPQSSTDLCGSLLKEQVTPWVWWCKPFESSGGTLLSQWIPFDKGQLRTPWAEGDR